MDDERGDTWQRVDLAADEIHPQAAWVVASREVRCPRRGPVDHNRTDADTACRGAAWQEGGGGGHGGAGPSLSSTLGGLSGQLAEAAVSGPSSEEKRRQAEAAVEELKAKGNAAVGEKDHTQACKHDLLPRYLVFSLSN